MSKSYHSQDHDRFDHRRKAAIKRAKRGDRQSRDNRREGRWINVQELFSEGARQ